MNVHKIRMPRPKKLTLINISLSLVCISLLLVAIWGYFHPWYTPLHPGTIIIQPNKSPVVSQQNYLFDDEFNETSLDKKKWNIQDSYKDGYHNCCLDYGVQYYTPKALSFSNGSLWITTRKQSIDGYPYTSGAIDTASKFSFLYGRVDVRAKLPKTQGYWPAIWMLPANIDSEDIAPFEIDVMELLGKDPTTVYMTNHWGTQQQNQGFTGPDFSQDYHIFSIVWTSKAIDWYIDGVQRFRSDQGISDQKMYLIINSTLGGSWGGDPDGSTVLPQSMGIDYVRVSQLTPEDTMFSYRN